MSFSSQLFKESDSYQVQKAFSDVRSVPLKLYSDSLTKMERISEGIKGATGQVSMANDSIANAGNKQ